MSGMEVAEIVNPFEELGIPQTSGPEEVRKAYHLKAKLVHPDQFQDAEQQAAANRKMVRLNQAYEEAMKQVSGRSYSPFREMLSVEDAVAMAQKLLGQNAPERALGQLMRAEGRSAAWFHTQGQVLMALEQYETAEQSFRCAVKMDPQNIEYRRGAFDAYEERKRAATLRGRIRHFLHKRQRKGKR